MLRLRPTIFLPASIELGEYAVFLPVGEVAVDGGPGWVVVGRVAPGDAGAVDVEDGIEDGPQVLGRAADVQASAPAFGASSGQHGFDELPAGV
jgi:hypothetical protein